MTSALGGGREGSLKSRRKEQNQLISVSDKGGRGSENPKTYSKQPILKLIPLQNRPERPRIFHARYWQEECDQILNYGSRMVGSSFATETRENTFKVRSSRLTHDQTSFF